MTTAAALRAACAATPDDRTTRLVLADLIGETDPLAAARFRCCVEPESDERRLQFADELERVDAEWAELVRVGVELAHWGGCIWKDTRGRVSSVNCQELSNLIGEARSMKWCDPCARRKHLHRRESALRTALETRLRLGRQCERCGGAGRRARFRTEGDPYNRYELIRDGDERCSWCSGRGWLGVLGEKIGASNNALAIGGVYDEWLIPATFTRGLVSGITCTMEWWQANGERVKDEWPVTDIDFSTHRPWQDRADGKWFCCGGDAEDAADGQAHEPIPDPIWDIIWTHCSERADDSGADFPAAARAALSAAALAWARGQG